MSNSTTTISVQIDKEDKEQVTKILEQIGISMSSLINMTIKQVIMRGAVPFEVGIPKNDDDLNRYFTKEELDASAKELAYIKTHLNEYESFDNEEDLKKALLSDD